MILVWCVAEGCQCATQRPSGRRRLSTAPCSLQQYRIWKPSSDDSPRALQSPHHSSHRLSRVLYHNLLPHPNHQCFVRKPLYQLRLESFRRSSSFHPCLVRFVFCTWSVIITYELPVLLKPMFGLRFKITYSTVYNENYVQITSINNGP